MSTQNERIKKNISDTHAASEASRYQKSGLSDKRAKLSSKNFDKLMQQRGLSDESIRDLKKSSVQGTSMEARHAKAGEKFVTTHGTESSSGIFVSAKSLGSTPSERIDKGALPHSNSAEYETTVELGKDQNLVYGKIAPQSKFSKMDPAQQPRNGGGEQVITDGGYRTGAVVNKDAKYPIPVDKSNRNNNTANTGSNNVGKSSNTKGNNKGQSM